MKYEIETGIPNKRDILNQQWHTIEAESVKDAIDKLPDYEGQIITITENGEIINVEDTRNRKQNTRRHRSLGNQP